MQSPDINLTQMGNEEFGKMFRRSTRPPLPDPGPLHYFQWKFKSYHPRLALEPELVYCVRIGNVPGVLTSWKEAQYQTFGVPNDVKRLKMR